MANEPTNPAPRRRGFNLLEMFSHTSDGNWREEDFAWIAEWGFDFVRLPMCYRLWADPADVLVLHEAALEKVDRGVELGRRNGLHVSLNFHRAPGYCINRGKLEEPFSLWKDREAQDAFCFHWQAFARRYHGIPGDELSFDLVNEPPGVREEVMTRADHERVIRAAVDVIRQIDAERPIVIDGLFAGNEPCPELSDLNVTQSCRAYLPMTVSHYKAHWVPSEDWPEPRWPGVDHLGEPCDRSTLEQHYGRWAALFTDGVGVHCGEGGCFNRTPRDVFLRWFRDVLEILTERGIGYALWNFRGSFGVLDSGRQDVDYEDFRGHALDRELLNLLQEF